MSIETILSWIYPVVLFYLHDGYNIIHIAFEPLVGSITSTNFQLRFIESIIWILIVLFPLITQFKGGDSNIFRVFLIGLYGVTVTFTVMYYNSDTIQFKMIHPLFIRTAISKTLVSIAAYKQTSTYQQICFEHSRFDDNHKTFSEYKYLKWIAYFSFHIIVFFYCVIWLDNCNLESFISAVHIPWQIIMMLFCILFPKMELSMIYISINIYFVS